MRSRLSDPGRFALRNAVRAAIVIPLALVIGGWVGDRQTALFAVFGSIALLVFADFGGPPAARLVAYLILVAVGLVLIAIGTLCSTEPVLAAVVMAVLAFVILFAGVINGYLAAGSSAALLTYILPVMVPGAAAVIPDRVLGFALAGCIAIPAALLLFPKRPRDRLRLAIATACDAVARAVTDPGPCAQAEAASAVGLMHRQFSCTPFRPTGPAGSTGALAVLIDELDWLRGLLAFSARSRLRHPATCGERALLDLSAAALDRCAQLLRGRRVPPVDEQALVRGRAGVLDEVEQIVRNPAVRDDDDRLWGVIVAAWEARVISYAAVDIARYAAVAGKHRMRGETGPGWLAFIRRQSVALSATGRVILAHADVRSVWFRNSLRGAFGLSSAVLLGQLVSLQHAFWVVLGSLSVLRSSALSTGATIIRAVIGTTVGIVIGGALLVAIGTSPALLWAVLPFACLLAAYAPRAISFAAGQAGFTVAVFVIFDLIAPTGWRIGLIRLEDVLIGFGISLLVGVLFWPRGAGAVLRRSIGTALAATARYAAAATSGVLAGGAEEQTASCAADAAAAQNRLDCAFRQRLAERSSDDPGLTDVSILVTATARVKRIAAAEHRLAQMIADAPRPPDAALLRTDGKAIADWYIAFGEAFSAHARLPAAQALDPLEHPAMLEAVRHSAVDSRSVAFAALACAWTGLHIDHLRSLERRFEHAARALERPDLGVGASALPPIAKPLTQRQAAMPSAFPTHRTNCDEYEWSRSDVPGPS